jgi:beta-propeller uncharacterized protein DUF5122
MVGSEARSNLAAVDLASGAALPWNPNVQGGSVDALAPGGAVMYAGGQFSSSGGFARSRLASIDLASGGTTAWDPSANGPVNALDVTAEGLYVAGTFNNIGGANRSALACIDPVAGLAMGWNPSATGSAITLIKSGGTLYAGGTFAAVNNLPHAGLAAMTEQPVGVMPGFGPRTSGLWLSSQPNPFHVSTLVRFALPQGAAVTLTITDVAGREVARPLDGRWLAAGEHSVGFAPRGWAAGVYLCTLRVQGIAETRKLVLTPR